MALRKVAVMGHPVLREVAALVPENEIQSDRIQTLLKDMVETMIEYDGRGLAAPQVHESIQMLVMLWDFTPNEEATLLCLINPVIKPITKETSEYWEGCLSVPGLRGKVSRPNRISVEAFNEQGEKLDFVVDGFAATVIQHECDHLQGKLYIDRMTDLGKLAFSREYERYHATPGEPDVAEEGGE
jgi:peptide deformylase